MLDAGAGAGGFLPSITTAVNELKAAASTGVGFNIDEEAGRDLQAAIVRLQDVLREGLQLMSRFDHEPPPLGTSPAADLYKNFIPTVASDPAQGSITAFRQMQQDLQVAYHTIGQSMARYRDAEQDSTSHVTSTNDVPA